MSWEDTKGRKVWTAQFREAHASNEAGDSVVELLGVEAGLYRDGKLVGKMAAPRINADSRTRKIAASGGARLESAADGSVVQAERITWESDKDKVHGSGGIKMARKNISVAATSFEADTGLKKATFTNGRVEVK